MHSKDMWCEDVDWIHLAQDRVQWLVLVNTVMKLQAWNFMNSSASISFSRRTLLHGVIN